MHRGLGFFYPQNVVRKSEPNYKGINMKSLEESVVTAMDGTDSGLFPFSPYILQYLWMLEELESEGRWEKAFAGSEDILNRLADEALAAHKNGKTKPLDIEAL